VVPMIYSLYFGFMLMSICFVRFVFFLFLLGWFCCFGGVYFIINDLVYSVDWNIITLNGRSFIMTFFVWLKVFVVILLSKDVLRLNTPADRPYVLWLGRVRVFCVPWTQEHNTATAKATRTTFTWRQSTEIVGLAQIERAFSADQGCQ
jgi:hypothetical protein